MTEIEGTRVPRSLPMGFSLSLYFAQSASRARLNRQPSLRHSVDLTDRRHHLGLGSQHQNAQISHYLSVDNIGIVSDHASQVHTALNQSKEDFEKEIGVSAGSGRAFGVVLDVEQSRTLAAVERFDRIRKGLRCFLKRRRAGRWELEALKGPRDLF